MKFTVEQYQKLKEAIAKYAITGVKTVTYGNKTVTYMSYEERNQKGNGQVVNGCSQIYAHSSSNIHYF